MTTKEIAEAVNKDVTTVQRWIKRLNGKMQSIDSKMQSSSPMKPAEFNLEETCSIIEVGLGKNAADIYRMNAKTNSSSGDSSLTARDIDLIGKLTASIVAETMRQLDARMGKIETRIEERQALLPPPEIKPRDQVNKIMREYAHKHGIEVQDAWRELYRDFGYRFNCSPKICAKNRGITTLDYIESEGMMDSLLAVAIELNK